MQSRNFYIHLSFIFTVFKHKYLKMGDTHEAHLGQRCPLYEDLFPYWKLSILQ